MWKHRKRVVLLIIISVTLITSGCTWINAYEQLSVDWSPTGDWIVFSCGDFPLSNPKGYLYIVRPDGSQLQRITTDGSIAKSPSWSSDGEWIAFLSRDAIYKTRPDASQVEKIVDKSSLEMFPIEDIYGLDWSSGDWITFNTTSLDGGRLYRVRSDGSDLELLFHRDGLIATPRWSPDNQIIAFVVAPLDPDAGIYTFSLETGEVEQVYDQSRGFIGHFDWSLDGTELIVSLGSGPSQLYRLNLSNHDLTPIEGLNMSPSSPAWSPDGESIVYVGIREDGADWLQMYKSRIDGSEAERLTSLEGCNVTHPQWFDFDSPTQ